jgi:hypothetical protein
VKVGENGTEFTWENLEKVIEAKKLFLMMYKDSKKLYFFIPNRAFGEEVTKTTFKEYLKAKSITVK